MKLFHEALGSGQTTDYFQVTNPCDVQITITGTYNSEPVHMELSPDHATWTDLMADGVLVEFTLAGEQRLLRLQPGYYRFVADSGLTDVDVYVDGHHVSF